MYPDLYKGLNLRPEDLTAYDSPLISFEGKTVTPKGQIILTIQTGSEVVEVNFIVVDAYSPYIAIVARPWIHALEAVSSTLHQKVGSELPPQEKEELVGFLRRNIDVFAWDAYDAPGVDPSLICHHLNVNPSSIPKKQPPRRPSKEHASVVRDEVMKLKKAGAIKEVFYPKWLANTVVVRKKTGKWLPLNELLERLPGLSSDTPCIRGSGEDGVHDTHWELSLQGIAIEKSLRFGFSATNNEAEYEALLQGMMMVRKLGGRAMEAFSDSKLVIGQVMGELEARDARMQEYLGRVKRL
ncbi:uncharacterized protein LOC126728165 [Quercus robur]|uniref:uncharacterized protein LOC126728165 n=1 Tax=Quercus robur TaxID=38942 RepID=UPI002163FBF8|nr:uncharacterized protein LOC126728165 [Quercus robur]